VLLTPDDGVAAALSAPTTEVFTGFGVEPGFDSSVREFAARVTAEGPVGYHGCAAGPSVEDIGKPDGEKGPAVMLVIGWDSKEAHTEAKGKPGGEYYPMSNYFYVSFPPFPFSLFPLPFLYPLCYWHFTCVTLSAAAMY